MNFETTTTLSFIIVGIILIAYGILMLCMFKKINGLQKCVKSLDRENKMIGSFFIRHDKKLAEIENELISIKESIQGSPNN